MCVGTESVCCVKSSMKKSASRKSRKESGGKLKGEPF